MINKWILDNFKSINREKVLEFRPMTIFTGANSSGKSTILQNILLVTQTLQSPIASRSIVLNGWFKKFGSYSDVVNCRDYSKNIKIGFSLKDKPSDRSEMYYRRRGIPGTGNVVQTDCTFIVSADGIDENLHPVLENMHMDMYADSFKFETLVVSKKGEPTEEEAKVMVDCAKKYPTADFSYSISTNLRQRLSYYASRDDYKLLGAGLFHFLPNTVLAYSSYKSRLKSSLSDYLQSGRSAYSDLENEDERLIVPLIKEKALKIAEDIYKSKKFNDASTFKKKYDLFLKKFTISRLKTVLSYSTLDGEEKQKYVKGIVEQLDSLDDHYVIERMPMYYHPGVEYVRDFFSEHIKYLGPLREEPKSLYPLETNGSSFDLGLKGENTAAVFENNKSKIISYIEPSFYDNGAEGTPVPVKGTLAEAINKWLVYLGVAKDMITNDRGKFGHELKIVTEIADLKQDLTHVGVGVSQILPILVLCFLSGNGDSIILEQPELHLHPKVQTRLADFFVSMNALGKQCILETHSEYLINRLRLLVAKATDTKIADETMIYFVEKDKEIGYSKYREITINPYGVIAEWPDGFFDEGEDLATQIAKAGMDKKRRELAKRK